LHTPPDLPTQPDARLAPPQTWFAPLEAYVAGLWLLLASALIPTWIIHGGAVYGPDIMRQIIGPYVLPALGLALALRQGRIDLSIWTVFTLASVVSARLMAVGAHPLGVLAAAIAVGACVGGIHALVVVFVPVPAAAGRALTGLAAAALSVLVTSLTGLAAMALAWWIAGGKVLVAAKAELARWPGADDELMVTGSLIIATVILLMPLSMSRYVGRARPGRRSASAAMVASAVLSAAGGLCWLLHDGRTPLPGHFFGDLRVPAAAVLAGAVVLTRPGRSALVAIMVPFAMAVVTAWRQQVWPTPAWPVYANLIALIVLLPAAQWSFRYALHAPGWAVKVWPILAGMGILSIALVPLVTALVPTSGPFHPDLILTAVGAGLWAIGSGAVLIHWVWPRLRPAPTHN